MIIRQSPSRPARSSAFVELARRAHGNRIPSALQFSDKQTGMALAASVEILEVMTAVNKMAENDSSGWANTITAEDALYRMAERSSTAGEFADELRLFRHLGMTGSVVLSSEARDHIRDTRVWHNKTMALKMLGAAEIAPDHIREMLGAAGVEKPEAQRLASEIDGLRKSDPGSFKDIDTLRKALPAAADLIDRPLVAAQLAEGADAVAKDVRFEMPETETRPLAVVVTGGVSNRSGGWVSGMNDTFQDLADQGYRVMYADIAGLDELKSFMRHTAMLQKPSLVLVSAHGEPEKMAFGTGTVSVSDIKQDWAI